MRGVLLAPQILHAPDGVFAVWLSILGWIIMMATVGLAIRKTKTQLGERQVPLMGIIAATIFAGQMLNFPIPGGTSGHLLGGALAAIIFGPWGGVLVMTAVIVVQALVFQDGGLLVMGLNVINMGIITSFSGYFVYRIIRRVMNNRKGLIVGGMIGGWISVVLTAAFTAVELALSGTSPLSFALPAMVSIHTLIGIGEGLLTVFALGFIMSARPDLVGGEQASGQRSAALVLGGLVVALAITLLAPLASGYQDGLESVLSTSAELVSVGDVTQVSAQTQASPYEILPGYSVSALGEGGLSTIAAGMIGVVAVFVLAYGGAWLSKRGRKEPSSEIPATSSTR